MEGGCRRSLVGRATAAARQFFLELSFHREFMAVEDQKLPSQHQSRMLELPGVWVAFYHDEATVALLQAWEGAP